MIKYILVNIESPDNLHIFKFVECSTGFSIMGRISGGESNLSQIMYNFDDVDGSWNTDAFYYYTWNIGKQQFNKMWKDLTFTGCERKALQDYIKHWQTL